MQKNEYRRALIMLRPLDAALSGHVRLERRTLMGSMQFTILGARAGDSLLALLAGRRSGRIAVAPLGAFFCAGRQAGLTVGFDPRNIQSMTLEQYDLVCVAARTDGAWRLALSGFLNGSKEIDWAALREAVGSLPGAEDRAAQPSETPKNDADAREPERSEAETEERAAESDNPDAPAPEIERADEAVQTEDEVNEMDAQTREAEHAGEVDDLDAPATEVEYAGDVDELDAPATEVEYTGFADEHNVPAQEVEYTGDIDDLDAPATEIEYTGDVDDLDAPATEVEYTGDIDDLDAPATEVEYTGDIDDLDAPATEVEYTGEIDDLEAPATEVEYTGEIDDLDAPAREIEYTGDAAESEFTGEGDEPDAPAIDRLGRSLRWPECAEPLRSLFETRPACEIADEFVYVRAPMPEGCGVPYTLVGVRERDGRIAEVAYAVPGEQSPEPPPGLSDYVWRDGYWRLTHECGA